MADARGEAPAAVTDAARVVDAARGSDQGASAGHDGAADRAPPGLLDGGTDAAPAADGPEAAGPDAAGATGARAPRPGDLFIDEVLVDPASDDLGREWFEVANLTAEPLDLSALHVSDDVSDVAVAGGVLAPGALALLGQSADPTKNGGAPVAHAYGTRLIFNNGGDRAAICLGACAGGLVLDTFSWGAELGAAYQGRAVVVQPAAAGVCPAVDPFGSAGSFGTPGQPNPPCSGAPDAAAM